MQMSFSTISGVSKFNREEGTKEYGAELILNGTEHSLIP
jgi:hypothetical protein